ncbi:aKG-HExxH-type peptide beta-hydroxylase [Nonomuraea sp. NPDC050536]|uniref:aKG-HExxH-type peptide beta-hydroxylase n=1 Tax=Nonomuraea sp. NPDC050536 TaxID=3364366 RepID=UPI0037C6FC9C
MSVVMPDEWVAAQEQAALTATLRRVLLQAFPNISQTDDALLLYPGFFSAAHRSQRDQSGGTAMGELLRAAVESQRRATGSGCSQWAVDLAPSEPHLRQSAERAIAQAPRPTGPSGGRHVSVIPWNAGQRAVFCDAASLVADAWPQMLAELRVVVKQIALLCGGGIAGYTDFATHGTVYISERRLAGGRGSLDPAIVLAESLIHEGTHNRCNAATTLTPLLKPSGGRNAPLLQTPLRSDPRPLSGLLQQLVVLVRCTYFYEQLMERSGLDSRDSWERHDELARQANQALTAARTQISSFTAQGRAVLHEAQSFCDKR